MIHFRIRDLSDRVVLTCGDAVTLPGESHFLGCRPIFVRGFIEEAGFTVLDATKMSLLNLPVEIILAKT